MKKIKAIEQAKQIAESDYNKFMSRYGCFDPDFIRPWKSHKEDNGSTSYALQGTPNKAFVFYFPKFKKVLAVRSNGTVLKTFHTDD